MLHLFASKLVLELHSEFTVRVGQNFILGLVLGFILDECCNQNKS